MNRIVLAALLAAICLGAPAIAADIGMPVKEPTPYLSNWSGFHAGLHVGYGWGRDPFEDPINGGPQINPQLGFTLNGIDSKGFVAGGHFGYNYQFGSLVGGLEIDISATEIKGAISDTRSTTSGFILTDTVTASRDDKFDLLGSARGRLGFLPMPNWLLYATGGLAGTQFTRGDSETETVVVTGPFARTQNITSSISTPSWRFGWAVGAGVEAKLFDSNWLVRLEYLHYDFGASEPTFTLTQTSTSIFSGTGTETFSSSSRAGRLTADVVRTGVSYKF